MKAFVTGASGYIGNAVAAALARAGHEVYGLVHTPAKAARVGAVAALPVLGDMDEPDAWRGVAGGCDVLVHAAAEYSARYTDLDWKTIDVLVGVAQTDRPTLIVYTSGCWIYGNTGDTPVDETWSGDPPGFMAWRAEHERVVLAANRGARRTLVIRPGCAYGGPGGLTAGWFATAMATGSAQIVGDGANHWTMVHVDDLAELYVRAAESELAGEILNGSDRSRWTVAECARAASRACGAGGQVAGIPLVQAEAEIGPSAQGLALDQYVVSDKAERLLGWTPRHLGFVEGAARCFESFKASR